MQDDKTKLNNLDKVVDGLDQSTAARKSLMDAELSMSINLIKFVRKEAPTFEKDISFAIAPLQKVVKLEESELNSEIRLADDLNDLIVRKRVITRLEQDQKSATDAYKQAKLDFENAKHLLQIEYNKKSTGKLLEIAEDKYKQAKSARIDALEKLRASTQKLLVEKQKFSKFMSNRISHGFTQYGNTINRTSQQISELYSQMTTSFSQIRNQIEVLSQSNIVNMPEQSSAPSSNTNSIFQAIKNPFDDLRS